MERFPASDEWRELERLREYVLDEDDDDDRARGRRSDRPFPDAFRLLAPPPSAWTTLRPRTRWRDQLWVDACPVVPPRPRPWPEGTVRRLVNVPFLVAVEALADALDEGDAAGLTVRAAAGWAGPGEVRVPGDLHLHHFQRCGRPVRVEVVLEPWSTTRSDLRLQVVCRHRSIRLPRHYYDAAHDAIDVVRTRIESSDAQWWWLSTGHEGGGIRPGRRPPLVR